MKTSFDWRGLIAAIIKAVLPFISGAIGDILAGCSMTGSGIGITV